MWKAGETCVWKGHHADKKLGPEKFVVVRIADLAPGVFCTKPCSIPLGIIFPYTFLLQLGLVALGKL